MGVARGGPSGPGADRIPLACCTRQSALSRLIDSLAETDSGQAEKLTSLLRGAEGALSGSGKGSIQDAGARARFQCGSRPRSRERAGLTTRPVSFPPT